MVVPPHPPTSFHICWWRGLVASSRGAKPRSLSLPSRRDPGLLACSVTRVEWVPCRLPTASGAPARVGALLAPVSR